MSLTIPKLQQLCDEARCWFNTQELIIAGGAPRDLLSGVPVKDIDIFVRQEIDFGEDTAFTRGCKFLAEILGGVAEFRPANEEYGNLLDLCDIKSASIHGLIQVISIDRCPVNDVHSYDFGLSQVFVTPAGLFYTEHAVTDRANRTITHFPTYENEAGFQRSKARYGRLQEKYQDWTFVNCDTLHGDSMPVPAWAKVAFPADFPL
jgi:hypothetical protein